MQIWKHVIETWEAVPFCVCSVAVHAVKYFLILWYTGWDCGRQWVGVGHVSASRLTIRAISLFKEEHKGTECRKMDMIYSFFILQAVISLNLSLQTQTVLLLCPHGDRLNILWSQGTITVSPESAEMEHVSR